MDGGDRGLLQQLCYGTLRDAPRLQSLLGQLLEVIPVSSGEIPDTSTIVASSFDPMSQMEYIIGYEQMVGQDWSFGIRGVHRNFVEVIEDFTIEASVLKVVGSETLGYVADECLQILGGYGYTREYPVERWHRDAKIHTIFEGTSEIQQLVISRAISGLRIP